MTYGLQEQNKGRLAEMQYGHTHKRSWHSMISWVNFADSFHLLDQIRDRCFVIVCVIDCLHIFSFLCFLFISIHRLYITKTGIRNLSANINLFRSKKLSKKETTGYWLKEKGNFRHLELQHFKDQTKRRVGSEGGYGITLNDSRVPSHKHAVSLDSYQLLLLIRKETYSYYSKNLSYYFNIQNI